MLERILKEIEKKQMVCKSQIFAYIMPSLVKEFWRYNDEEFKIRIDNVAYKNKITNPALLEKWIMTDKEAHLYLERIINSGDYFYEDGKYNYFEHATWAAELKLSEDLEEVLKWILSSRFLEELKDFILNEKTLYNLNKDFTKSDDFYFYDAIDDLLFNCMDEFENISDMFSYEEKVEELLQKLEEEISIHLKKHKFGNNKFIQKSLLEIAKTNPEFFKENKVPRNIADDKKFYLKLCKTIHQTKADLLKNDK